MDAYFLTRLTASRNRAITRKDHRHAPRNQCGAGSRPAHQPAHHIFATRLAWQLVGIVQACLEDEMQLLATEYYRAIIQDLRDYEAKRAGR